MNSFQPCVNLLNPLELRTGTATTYVPSAVRSCTTLAGASTGNRIIHWSTGTTSTFAFTASVNYLAGGAAEFVLQGSITAGEFQGATVVQVEVLASGAFANCGTTGVPTFSGTATLTIAQ